MEKHHKLRRPQGSSIHGCNICGIEGHQAAFCMNGNVDWANRWPRECFVIEPPSTTRKTPDLRKLARDAKAYAKSRERKLERERRRAAGEEVSDSEEEVKKEEEEKAAPTTTAAAGGIAPGWVMYYDKLGRPYYHNKLLNKTQWTAPTAQAP